MGIRNIAVTITANSSNLRKELLLGSSAVQKFTSEVEGSNKRTALSWHTAGVVAAAGVTAVAVGLGASAVAAAQFETRMRNVNSLVHLNDAQFKAMNQSVLQLSTQLPQSANTLAEGLYDITSSGFSGANALLVLKQSAQAASAGLTTTATAAQAIDAVLNAYGLSASSAQNVSDTLFQTVNLGVINFQELAGTIGEVVGLAAAAKVPIQDVGSAIATITLSGITAAESGTALNRVLQTLIAPGDALKQVYHSLGIESGAAALQSQGLKGVLDDIRKATGGNVTTLQQLFPDVRALKGAFALMSDEGRTYTRVSQAISDENARQGATHKALQEQMKATSFQLKLVQNEATAAAISVGAHVLPVFLDFLRGTQQLGQEAVPLLRQGISAVTPLFEALYRTGANVVEILGTLFHAVEPISAALLKVAGSALIGGLTLLAQTLQTVTGFLAHHQVLVQAVAALYVATLLPSVTAVTVAFNRFILTPVILGLNALIGAAAGTTTSLGALTASMLSLQAVATLGVAVALFALFRGFSQLHAAQRDAKSDIDKQTASFNALDTQRAQQQLAKLRQEQLDSINVGQKYDGVFGTFRAGWNSLVGDNSIAKAAYQGEAAGKSFDELNQKLLNTNGNLVRLSAESGYTVDAITKLALAQNIDLTADMFSPEGIAARTQVLNLLKDIEKQSHTTGAALQGAAGLDIDAIQALGQALADVQKKVKDTFSRDTDVLGSFDPKAAAEAQAGAADQVKQAVERLADARKRAGADGKQSVSDTISIKNAQEDLAKAQQNAAKTAQEQPATLAAAYGQTLRLAQRFTSDIQTAEARGLDPTAIAHHRDLGPKQAEPILQQLVADHSGRLIAMVNKSEAALAQISARVVEQSRLVALATNATSDKLSKNLTAGLRVSSEALNEGGKATVQSVAKALGVPDARVRALAQAFGITLRDNIQKGLDKKPLVAPTLTVGGTPATRDRGFATGGLLTGPGHATSDNLIIRVSPGEYVQRAAAVSYYGSDFMDRLNRLQLPRFASGGAVGGVTVRGGLSSGDVAAIASALATMGPRQTTHHNVWTAYDYDAAQRQARDYESVTRLGGG